MLGQKIVPLLGASCLSKHSYFSVHNSDNRLDGQNAACQGGGFGDTPAFFQIFKGIQQGNELNSFFGKVQLFHDFFGGSSLILKTQGIFDQSPFPYSNILGIHHKGFSLKFLCRDTGALVSAGELARHGNDNGAASVLRGLLKGLREGKRRNLAGGGQSVALDEPFKKFLMGEGYAVKKFGFPKGDGHGKDGQILPVGIDNI